MGWLKRIGLRREAVKELKRKMQIARIKIWSINMQIIQIESHSPKAFSFPYRIKFMELLDLYEEVGMLEYALRVRNWAWILTGKQWKK